MTNNIIKVNVKKYKVKVKVMSALAGSSLSKIETTMLSGEPLSALRVIRGYSDGKAYIADTTDTNHADSVLGLSITAVGAPDEEVRFVSDGLVPASGTWILDKAIFFDFEGRLTQTPPTVGFSLIVGIPKNTTDMIVRIGSPIILT